MEYKKIRVLKNLIQNIRYMVKKRITYPICKNHIIYPFFESRIIWTEYSVYKSGIDMDSDWGFAKSDTRFSIFYYFIF